MEALYMNENSSIRELEFIEIDNSRYAGFIEAYNEFDKKN
jgi:hypothetical protein